MKETVGKWAADALMEEDEHEAHFGALISETHLLQWLKDSALKSAGYR